MEPVHRSGGTSTPVQTSTGGTSTPQGQIVRVKIERVLAHTRPRPPPHPASTTTSSSSAGTSTTTASSARAAKQLSWQHHCQAAEQCRARQLLWWHSKTDRTSLAGLGKTILHRLRHRPIRTQNASPRASSVRLWASCSAGWLPAGGKGLDHSNQLHQPSITMPLTSSARAASAVAY